MKAVSTILIVFAALATGALTSGCWTDTENYSSFVCERFGGDADNDGVCSRNDCNDYNPFIYPGAPCDDGDPETEDDAYNAQCECVGQ